MLVKRSSIRQVLDQRSAEMSGPTSLQSCLIQIKIDRLPNLSAESSFKVWNFLQGLMWLSTILCSWVDTRLSRRFNSNRPLHWTQTLFAINAINELKTIKGFFWRLGFPKECKSNVREQTDWTFSRRIGVKGASKRKHLKKFDGRLTCRPLNCLWSLICFLSSNPSNPKSRAPTSELTTTLWSVKDETT